MAPLHRRPGSVGLAQCPGCLRRGDRTAPRAGVWCKTGKPAVRLPSVLLREADWPSRGLRRERAATARRDHSGTRFPQRLQRGFPGAAGKREWRVSRNPSLQLPAAGKRGCRPCRPALDLEPAPLRENPSELDWILAGVMRCCQRRAWHMQRTPFGRGVGWRIQSYAVLQPLPHCRKSASSFCSVDDVAIAADMAAYVGRLIDPDVSRARDTEVRWRSIGPALLFGALWDATCCVNILRMALRGRRFGFDVERAVFASVLHRIMVSGSDRQACRWMRDQAIPGTAGLDLHQFYRAMAWPGTPLAGEDTPEGKFSPCCTKDWIEEELFAERRDLYTDLDMVFFDTTSLYFHGEGGTELSRHGKSKDFRPQCKQLVVGMVLRRGRLPRCLGNLAWEHRRRQSPGSGRRAAAGALRAPLHLCRRGTRHDQPGDPRVDRSARLALHSRRTAPQQQGDQGESPD